MPVNFKLTFAVPSVAISFDKKQTAAAIRTGVKAVAKVARGLVRGSGGGGRQYGSHQASAPGEPPAKFSGLLAGSIRTSVRARGQEIIGRVLDAARDAEGKPYSRFLETGAAGGGPSSSGRTRSHRKRSLLQRKSAAMTRRMMAPRPYLSTALDSQHSVIEKLIADAVQADIKLVMTHAP